MTILATGPVMAILRYRRPGDLDAVVRVLAEAGVPLIEITLDTPGALEAIERLAASGVIVGAGTVRTRDEVGAAVGAGAAFVVSPALYLPVIDAARDRGVEAVPGILSPTELATATAAGAPAVKVFPAGPAGGPAYMRALRGPFPDVDLLPTGGIDPGEVAEYLEAGATCVGLGGALTGGAPPSTADELAEIGRRATTAMRGAKP